MSPAALRALRRPHSSYGWTNSAVATFPGREGVIAILASMPTCTVSQIRFSFTALSTDDSRARKKDCRLSLQNPLAQIFRTGGRSCPDSPPTHGVDRINIGVPPSLAENPSRFSRSGRTGWSAVMTSAPGNCAHVARDPPVLRRPLLNRAYGCLRASRTSAVMARVPVRSEASSRSKSGVWMPPGLAAPGRAMPRRR